MKHKNFGLLEGSSRRPIHGFLLLGLLLALGVIILSGCRLDTGAVPAWVKAEARPGFVCPGDFVTIDWEMGVSSSGCLGGSGAGGSADDELRDCRGFTTITSSPNVFIPPAPSEDHTGTELVTISSATTFTFNGRKDGQDWPTEVRTVNILATDAITTIPVLFEGTCSGSSPGWVPVDMGAWTSEFVQVEGICNMNSFPIIVNSSSLGRGATLEPGACTNDLDGKPGTLSAFPSGISPLIADVDCSPTRAIPPAGFELEVGMRCSTGSASMEIVEGTPEATEEEPVTFVTNTPLPATPTSAPISVNFNADTYSLISGECTRLRWDVKNAEVLTLESQPVLPLEAEQVCPPTTKTYKMVASNSTEEVESFVTIEVSVPVVPPKAPAQLNIVNQVCTGQTYTVTLGWIDAADNEDGYRVYRDGALIATLGPNTKGFTDNPPYGGPYTYGVEAFNSAGSSSRPTVQEGGCIS
jgi:hypothetical protein